MMEGLVLVAVQVQVLEVVEASEVAVPTEELAAVAASSRRAELEDG